MFFESYVFHMQFDELIVETSYTKSEKRTNLRVMLSATGSHMFNVHWIEHKIERDFYLF